MQMCHEVCKMCRLLVYLCIIFGWSCPYVGAGVFESVIVSMRVHVLVQDDLCDVLLVCVSGHNYINVCASKAETRRL